MVLDEGDDEDSMDGSNVDNGQNIDDDDDSLFHKPASGISGSNALNSSV